MFKLLLLFLLFTTSIYSQSRLGSSRSEIFTEYISDNPKFHTTDDGVSYMTVMLGRAHVSYVFNSNNICIMCTIIPLTQGDLNSYVELYNTKYVIVSSTSWKMYSENGSIASVELQSSDDTPMFIWTIIK